MFLLFLLSLIEDDKYSQFFHQLYTKYQRRMFYAAWRILKHPPTAEDVMQDTFYVIASNDRVLEKLMELSTQSELYVINYITKMCRNNAMRKAGTAAARKEYAAEINDELLSKGYVSAESKFLNPEEMLCHCTDKESVKNAMHKLSESDEILLNLLYFQNFTMDEIAQQLNITKNALYVRHHRALKSLSQILRQGAAI